MHSRYDHFRTGGKMVGIIGGIVAIVLLLIVGLVAFSFIGTTIIDLTQQGQDFLDLLKIDIKPQAGETVCDISIIISGDLADNFFDAFINNIKKSYQWFDCHNASAISLFSLINSNENLNPQIFAQPLSVLTFGECVDIHVTLVDISGQRRNSPIKSVCFNLGLIDTPFEMRKIFLFDSIPDRNYDLEIFFDNPTLHIEGKQAGAPLLDRICKTGLSSC